MTSSLPGGTIRIAGKTVSRLGLGTMRLTGAGTWGDPDDRDQALGVLRARATRGRRTSPASWA
ncbi:hypothetical protein ACFWN5_42515 [Streptomyces sp. NPDC058430]|uniref:hypothetical protein n=1 Tax=unclassified Streptomyces TaxID=2593676 RepID=UPI00363B0FAF